MEASVCVCVCFVFPDFRCSRPVLLHSSHQPEPSSLWRNGSVMQQVSVSVIHCSLASVEVNSDFIDLFVIILSCKSCTM